MLEFWSKRQAVVAFEFGTGRIGRSSEGESRSSRDDVVVEGRE